MFSILVENTSNYNVIHCHRNNISEKISAVCEGYCTGMIDANKDGNTPHNTRPLLLATTFLSENVVEIWIQQTNNGCTTASHNHKFTEL